MAENRYRKIEVRMWGDEKFRMLSPLPPSGQSLWLFLLTGPHTGPIPGLFRVGRAALAEELGWPQEAFDKAFDEVFRLGMVKADWKARVVWIPNAIKCNPPQSPNVVRSWASELHLVPECGLKAEAYRTIESMIYGLGDGFRKAFAKAIQKPSVEPLPNQEQEQEQEQERKPSAANASVHEKLPPQTAQHSPEIIPPDRTGILETPDGLHPNQYATRLLEEIKFPVVPHNIRAVAAAIECEAKTMGLVAAYEFVLECTKFAIFEECEINTFFFTDGKYRPERRNGNGRQLNKAEQRQQSNLAANARAKELIRAKFAATPGVGK
jgi:hypothetical protein